MIKWENFMTSIRIRDGWKYLLGKNQPFELFLFITIFIPSFYLRNYLSPPKITLSKIK